MSHLPFTLLAYLLNSVAVTIDKFMITKKIPDPLTYIFYFSVLSAVMLLLIPFTHIPTGEVFLYASVATVFWSVGAYCMFSALRVGQVSRVVPVIGTLIPIFLLIQASLTNQVNLTQTLAVIFLILGIISLTFHNWKGEVKSNELVFILLSGIFFASSYIFLRQAYEMDNFLTVFVWSRFVLIPIGILIILVPALRKRALTNDGPPINFFSKIGALFIGGQIAGGSSELLLSYSIHLANPALVNSLQGSQYIFLFISSLVLSRKYPSIFKESLSRIAIIGKIVGIACIGLGLYILAFSGK